MTHKYTGKMTVKWGKGHKDKVAEMLADMPVKPYRKTPNAKYPGLTISLLQRKSSTHIHIQE